MRCDITGAGCLFGHNVSHAKNRTKTRWLPNLRVMKVYSKTFGQVELKVSSNGLRTIEKHGGFDEYLSQTLDRKLTKTCLFWKNELLKKTVSK